MFFVEPFQKPAILFNASVNALKSVPILFAGLFRGCQCFLSKHV